MKRVLSLLLVMMVVFGTLSSVTTTVYADYNANLTAHKKIDEILQSYVDPNCYLELEGHYFTDSQEKELRAVAKKAVKGSKTKYEKISAITKYVAENVYYDLSSPYIDPYDVFKNKRTYCLGYALLTNALLNFINIPCMFVEGDIHGYNVAYDSDNDEWVYLDATWASGNVYNNGKFISGSYNSDYFDMSLKRLSKITNHEFYDLEGIMINGLEYKLETPNDPVDWADIDDWYISVSGYGNVNGSASISKSIKKIPVTNIKDYALEGCTTLATITIPDSVKKIGYQAFYGCKKLNSITISNSVTSIDHYAFKECTSLTSIKIPNSVTNIGAGVFYGCTGLISVEIPDGIKKINGNLFDGCTSLKSVTIPDSVKSIGSRAFRDCSALTSITIPKNVTKIGEAAFEACEKLSSVYITDVGAWCNIAFKSYDSNPLWYADKLYLNGELATDVVIPDGVTAIPDSAFSCDNITSVKIPNSVTRIGIEAFNYCTSLTSITIPDSVTSIGESAFYGCENLTTVKLSDNVTKLDWNLFNGCTNLTSITIPDSVTYIGSYVFENCSNLSLITIPDSVIFIGEDAFSNTAYYNDYDNWEHEMFDYGMCENSILYIGNHLIDVDSSSTTFTVRPGTKTIAGGAFSDQWFVSVKIPNGVISIGDFAFSCCTELASIVIPESVTDIGRNAFYNCSSLTSIVLPNGLTSIGMQTFDGCTSLQSITIPNSVKSIDRYAYDRCDSLTDVYYTGSIVQWSKIKIADSNESLTKANIHFGLIEKPIVPKLTAISNETNGIKISWKAVLGADKYRVYRKTSKGDWTYLGTTTKTYYTDKSAKSGTKYYYAVKSQNEAGNSSLSSSLSKYYLADPTLKTPSSSKSGVKLTWTKVSGAEGYMVYRKTGTGSYSRIATVKGSTKVTYTDKSARKGKKYTYKVKAYKSKTYSAYSNTKTIKDKY